MFIEENIINLQRRIKNIEEHPRPEFLKCNKLLYELELENLLHVEEVWKENKPFARLGAAHHLTRPLGFEPGIGGGDRVRDPQRYYDIAVNKFGFPQHTCDRTITSLGLMLSGEVPLPKIFVYNRIPCDPERWSAMAAAKYAGVLSFELNRLCSCDYDNIAYVAEQLAKLIEFCEKSVPGIKYNEDKLIELLEMDAQAMKYLEASYELRKMVPCPISPQDTFRLVAMPSNHPNPAKMLEYCRLYQEELFERAEKGIGGVHEEKLRIAWLATGPFGRSTFDLLNRKGVSLPWFHYGVASHYFGVVRDDYGDDSVYGRKLTPLEELVRMRHWNTNSWAGEDTMWVSSLVKACRELKIDAAVDFLQVGCVVTKNLKRITSQKLREELGIPTLDLEGREFFATEGETIEMNKKLEEFLDLCIANKK